jgi:pimeloyl-ACP methyl ester carboxylesterase
MFTVYLHGLPGSPRELELFAPLGSMRDAWAPDRNADRSNLDCAAYFDHLAVQITAQSANDSTHLVGFSLGAAAALQVAHRLGNTVSRIDLISAAAPLELGTFLPHMVGRPVFESAIRRPWLFSAMTSAQALVSRLAPGTLMRMLLASAQGADRGLTRDAQFRMSLRDIIGASFPHGARGYRREILGYVQPWASLLSGITAPVTLWHGTADNWSPMAMAERLQAALPNARPVVRLEGQSHYSTLKIALKQLGSHPSTQLEIS